MMIEKSPLRIAGIVGAVAAVVGFTVDMRPPPLDAALDPFVWLVYGVVAFAGAFLAVSVVLAWRTMRTSPRWLFATLVGLLLISVPLVASFVRERREAQRFLATAASTQGLIVKKYVRGGVHLAVEYEAAGQRYRVRASGQNPYLGTQAFREWSAGDSIPVYYQPAAPRAPMVGVPGPNPRFLFEALAKLWAFWGLMLTAYLPLVARCLRRSSGRPRPEYRLPHARGQVLE